ncbi:helix-turn-helix domain-containing protein [Levilactobacillus humaensis]|uniref:helix-turn-helix domain-containing protein n=1 Tax=Levilactobacillus humaensis TaxID=2950375 RepID=UPI0021C3CD4A|nr:helix-turn-helix domain-containing protein [Levilactobacillus humaensis]
MKIDFAMLTAREILKIRLLTFMNDHGRHFNLTDFAESTSVSYSRAYHVLLSLRADLKVLDAQTTLTKDDLQTAVTMDGYRHWLYTTSLPYQMMMATLTQKYPTIAAFCEDHQISSSTFNRRIRPMKQQLAQYDLQFAANPLRLTGNEALIELLYFMLFSTTITAVGELPAIPAALQPLRRALIETYTNDELYQESTSLAQRRELLITVAVLRWSQGHRYKSLRFAIGHLVDLRQLAGMLQASLGVTPQVALRQLAPLDYLLTSSPYFVRALQPHAMVRLYLALKQHVGSYELAPGVPALSDYATGRNWFANWLFALCQFMLLFRVDPLLRPEITALYQPTDESKAAALAIAKSMQRLYPQQVIPADLRLVQRYLSKYTNGLTLTASKVEILVTYDMIGVTTDIFNRLLSGIVHLSLLTDQTVIDPDRRDNYLVIYGVDPLAAGFAEQHQLESFHWVKEIAYGENLDRLIGVLRHHDLSLFALDFNNRSHQPD